MAVFKRLVQNPSSPDKDIKAAGSARYKQSAFARLTDTNALSRDLNDQILYTLPLTDADTGTQAITTRKGVVKITTTNNGPLTITLTTTSTSELLVADADNYFVQATVSCGTSGVLAYAMAKPIFHNNQIVFTLVQTGGATAWENATPWDTVYLNYEIVKIGD